jgi:hypothetical protein
MCFPKLIAKLSPYRTEELAGAGNDEKGMFCKNKLLEHKQLLI